MIGGGRPPRGLLLVLLWLVALNLRTIPIGVAPVLTLIRADLAISYAEAGILFALPVAVMGLGAVPGARLADRLGTWQAINLSLALISLGGGLRTWAPDYAAMLGLTVLYSVGIGLAQPSLPRLVREWFPHHRASVTGVYTAGLIGGAIVAAAVTGPLLLWLGPASWRGTCLVWAALAAASLVVWLLAGPRRGPALTPALSQGESPRAPGEPEPPTAPPLAEPASPASPGAASAPSPPALSQGERGAPPTLAIRDVPVWRDRTAWLITLVFLLQGLIFYQLNGWLPTYYLELGFDVESAGWPLTLFNLVMLPVSLGITYLSDRVGRRRPFLVGSCVVCLVGMVGLLISPLVPWWLWCIATGSSLGIIFALSLALPIDLLDPRRAGATISLVFTVGYTGALASPLLAGALRDALGSFTEAFFVALGLGLAMLVVVLILPETGRGVRGGGP